MTPSSEKSKKRTKKSEPILNLQIQFLQENLNFNKINNPIQRNHLTGVAKAIIFAEKFLLGTKCLNNKGFLKEQCSTHIPSYEATIDITGLNNLGSLINAYHAFINKNKPEGRNKIEIHYGFQQEHMYFSYDPKKGLYLSNLDKVITFLES